MHKKLFLLLGFLSLALVGIFALKADVVAQTTSYTLSGYAWSPNIGWISFKSPSGLYGVKITKTPDVTAHPLTGYAWSSNVGWVSFNYVELPNACKVGPTINMTTGVVTGNAVVLAGKDRTDGWDGCIDLTGVRMDPTTGVFSGYAWGGEVVGWIDVNPSANLKCDDCTTPVVELSGSCTNSFLDQYPDMQDVDFWVSANGGTAPYNVILYFADGNNTPLTLTSTDAQEYIYSYERKTANSTYFAYIKITDSTGATKSIPCGAVVIEGNGGGGEPPPSGSTPALKMMIGSQNTVAGLPNTDYTDCPDLSCPNKKYSIRQGKPFSLKINSENIPISCQLTSNKFVASDFTRNITGATSINITNTSGTVTGRHTISIKCPTTPTAIESTVQLDVSSASIIEI